MTPHQDACWVSLEVLLLPLPILEQVTKTREHTKCIALIKQPPFYSSHAHHHPLYCSRYVLPGPPNNANLLTILGPISSYSAFVWQ